MLTDSNGHNQLTNIIDEMQWLPELRKILWIYPVSMAFLALKEHCNSISICVLCLKGYNCFIVRVNCFKPVFSFNNDLLAMNFNQWDLHITQR